MDVKSNILISGLLLRQLISLDVYDLSNFISNMVNQRVAGGCLTR